MKTHITGHQLKLGRSLSDTELAAFAGGVTEGGCVPNPMPDIWEKLRGGDLSTIRVVVQQ